MTMTEPLRVVVFKDGEAWVARALEHDICVQAMDLETLYKRFELTVQLESQEGSGLSDIEPAPGEYHEMWENKPETPQLKLCA